MDFDPGDNVSVLISNPYDPLEGNCQDNIFISKLDTSGNFIWVKQLKGHYTLHKRYINLDELGNIHTSGHFQTINCRYEYTTGELTITTGATYFCLFKLDSSGNILSEKQLSTSNNFMEPDTVSHAYTDADGNNYLVVNFHKELFYTSDTETITINNANYFEDSVIFKLNPSGELLWYRQFKGDENQHINALSTDVSNNVYATGYFTGLSNFGTETEIFNLNSFGHSDIFISKLNELGNLEWVKQLGGTSDDIGNSITVDIYDNVFTCGNFQETVDFNTGANTNDQISLGKSDVFIHKLEQKTLSTEINQSDITETIYPNPSNGLFNISLIINKNTPYIITDITGKFITKGILINSNTTINLSEITNGIYLFITEEKSIRLIKQ